MKTLIVTIVLALSVTACGLFDLRPDDTPIRPDNQTQTITGTVVENSQQVPADGNNVLVVETETGTLNVLYMEGGLVLPEFAEQQCNNNDSVAQFAQTLQVGDRVEIFGATHENYDLEVCSNTDFYITLLETDPSASADTRQVTGEIIEVIGDCAFDGNCAYVVETADGEQVTVIWAEGMSPICQNDPFNGAGNNDIALGDTIETLGRVIDDTTTSACGDESYYIRKI